jgi:4-carboxymuconolactone decarboxylase
MTDEQHALAALIVSGPRGRIVGPLRAALHSPKLAEKWEALGIIFRYGLCLDPRIRELAIITCGRHWNSAVEWWVHAEDATAAGIPLGVIEAIRDGGAPVFPEILDFAVYEFTRELVEEGHVADAAYDLAYRLLGVTGIVELTGLIGYYSMVAMMLNAHHVPLPGHEPGPPWRYLPDPGSGLAPLSRAVMAAETQ